MRVLGIDPGSYQVTKGTTGLAVVKGELQKLESIEPVPFEIKGDPAMFDWLKSGLPELRPDVVVVENWVQRPNFREEDERHDFWLPQPTAKLIGAIKAFCFIHQLRYFEQEPAIKPTGYKLLGMKYVKNKKGMHRQDAASHAAFFLMNGVAKNADRFWWEVQG